MLLDTPMHVRTDMDNPTDTPEAPAPPSPPHAGNPVPTAEDPTAQGFYCGANRKPQQIAAAIEEGRSAWPYCMNRAGKGTTHVGIGRCRHHFGATPDHRRHAMLRYAELHAAAIETFARALVEQDCPWPTKIRAAENIEDRSGFPRRVEVDADQGRARMYERILERQQADRDHEDDDQLDEEND